MSQEFNKSLERTDSRKDPGLEIIIAEFVHRLPTRHEDLLTALVANDYPLVAMLAHRLKGASNFGFPKLTVLATRLEAAAQSKDRATCQMLLGEVESFIEGLSKSST